MPKRRKLKFPNTRGLYKMEDMHLIRLFARMAKYEYRGMTYPERMEWEHRLRAIYKEVLRRFGGPGEPAHRGRNAATVREMIG